MQCEVCSEHGNVRITEVSDGKPVDRHFCERHAAKLPGGSGTIVLQPEEWEAFLGRAASYFRDHGTLPTAAEMAQQGEVGARMAMVYERWATHGAKDMLDKFHQEVQKRTPAA